MTDKSPIQRIKELDEERAALFEQAKEEALRRATQAVEDLNALGLNYRLDQRFRNSNHIRQPYRAYSPRYERRAPD